MALSLVALTSSAGVLVWALFFVGRQNDTAVNVAVDRDAAAVNVAAAAGIAKITTQYKVIQRFPHDPKAFCQGLQWHNHHLIESTGMYGESQVRRWNPWNYTNSTNTTISMDPSQFGEGLCWFRDPHTGTDRYIQLTYHEQTAWIYDQDLHMVDSKSYTTTTGEGWGITFDPHEQVLYVTDGSTTILVWNLECQELRRFSVTVQLPWHDERQPLGRINELEWDVNDHTILANVWFQNVLVRIDPRTGYVLEVMDLTHLYPLEERQQTLTSNPEAVMNGIAHYHEHNQWFVTGKYWPYLYLIEFHRPNNTVDEE